MHTTYWGRHPLNRIDRGVFPVIDFSLGIFFPTLTVNFATNENHFGPQWHANHPPPPAAATRESIDCEHSRRRTHPEYNLKNWGFIEAAARAMFLTDVIRHLQEDRAARSVAPGSHRYFRCQHRQLNPVPIATGLVLESDVTRHRCRRTRHDHSGQFVDHRPTRNREKHPDPHGMRRPRRSQAGGLFDAGNPS